MVDCIYCTPEWLDESAKIVQATPRYQEIMKRLSVRIFFRITAEPEWGIDRDFLFGGIVEKGVLSGLRFYNEDEAQEIPELILSATPQEWKLILRKDHKFITDFMLGKIKLEKGTIARVVSVAPYADAFVDALTQVNLIFQDELDPQQMEEYKAYAAQFRPNLII